MKRVRIIFTVGVIFAVIACGGRAPKKSQSGDGTSSAVSDSMLATRNYPVFSVCDSLLSLNPVKGDTLTLDPMGSGEVLKRVFYIENKSKKALVINDVRMNCNCITLDYDPAPIAPHGRRAVTLTYDSGGQMGIQFKRLDFVTSLSDTPYPIYVMAQVNE